jgi:small redox-active disulfide protein 2
MKNIKVLGTGCTNCKTTMKLIEEAAKEKGVEIQLEKIKEIQDIMAYGVMSTPGVAMDGKVWYTRVVCPAATRSPGGCEYHE